MAANIRRSPPSALFLSNHAYPVPLNGFQADILIWVGY